MDKREKVINGLAICKEDSKLCFGESECGYQSCFPRCWITLASDALALLKALDVTPEELERLKKCRHECKIDCLLEHYEKIKAERDALLEAQEPVAVIVVNTFSPECPTGYCPKCRARIIAPYNNHFCGTCGRAVKWE